MMQSKRLTTTNDCQLSAVPAEGSFLGENQGTLTMVAWVMGKFSDGFLCDPNSCLEHHTRHVQRTVHMGSSAYHYHPHSPLRWYYSVSSFLHTAIDG